MLLGDLLPAAEHVLHRDETNLAEVRSMLRRHGLVLHRCFGVLLDRYAQLMTQKAVRETAKAAADARRARKASKVRKAAKA